MVAMMTIASGSATLLMVEELMVLVVVVVVVGPRKDSVRCVRVRPKDNSAGRWYDEIHNDGGVDGFLCHGQRGRDKDKAANSACLGVDNIYVAISSIPALPPPEFQKVLLRIPAGDSAADTLGRRHDRA
ncbi:hypothetical protein EAI_07482 [Harpegnathos saltator]|uniref:Uncharacterized protein n=1 Tax=Harpegnathos saltator TaxID=610380 RepID=E2B5E7_HARSA|nr:hypothetical protein EAI_07482 [Harpegnathos saltator]